MTSQEKELLSRFLQQMIATRAGQKDAEAEALIRQAVAQQPDATYLLVQRAMQLEQLLEATEAHAQKLQGELDAARAGSAGSGSASRSGSFLNDPAWGQRPSQSASSQPAGQRSVSGLPIGAPPASPASAAPQATAAARPTGWGGGSMLGTVASTAAGVVAGSFLFQGIQGLMHRNDNLAGDHHNSDRHGLLDNPDQQGLADSSHTAGSIYEDEPASNDLNDLASGDADAIDGFASGDDYA